MKSGERKSEANANIFIVYQCIIVVRYFHLLSLISYIWQIFAPLLFLVCFSISIIIPTFAAVITLKSFPYGTSKETRKGQRTDSPPYETAQQRQQESVSRYIP